ncbi:McrC family protein [Flavilitoribacter nigricans]|nr:hypothetical protein [Flavilitoribacter nigricans]
MPQLSGQKLATPFPPVIRVYEHDVLRIGDQCGDVCFSERHLESLAELSGRMRQPYFSLGHRSVRFRSFVGILATSALTVEILPKADRQSVHRQDNWQGILVDLLQACGFVRTESPGMALLDTRPGALLDWYLRTFIAELRALLRHGLLHQYRTVEAELGVLKGKLNVSRQIRQQAFHRERFQVQYDRYSNRHPANLMIGAALHKLQFLTIGSELRTQLKYLAELFPRPTSADPVQLLTPEDLHRDRRLDRYGPALTIARHILQDERPDIRSGAFRGLALLFDMNQLFEAYLYRQLLQWKVPGMDVERQQSTVFWGQNRLRPDLVIASPQGRWVLDTKWRLLQNQQPSAAELRQVYVYCDYFRAHRGVLIFPHTGPEPVSQLQSYAPLPAAKPQYRSCQLLFARVLNPEGQLNRELGRELVELLGIAGER